MAAGSHQLALRQGNKKKKNGKTELGLTHLVPLSLLGLALTNCVPLRRCCAGTGGETTAWSPAARTRSSSFLQESAFLRDIK